MPIFVAVCKPFDFFQTKVLSSSSWEVLPTQQPAVLGPHNSNIRLISGITGAAVHHLRTDLAGATTFYILGTVETVLNERKYLIVSYLMEQISLKSLDCRWLF